MAPFACAVFAANATAGAAVRINPTTLRLVVEIATDFLTAASLMTA
jgi:hypothetical protein